MSAAELGPWAPMSVGDVVEFFSANPIDWWFAGGTALELHIGRSWRTHHDIDVGVCRAEDWHDVLLIHECFGLPIPADYARWVHTS